MKPSTKVDIDKLRHLRNQHGYTQEQIGKMLGVTGSNYYHREAGHMAFRADELAILAELYRQPLDELFCPGKPTYFNIGMTHRHPGALQAIRGTLEEYREIIVDVEQTLERIDQTLSQQPGYQMAQRT